MTSEKESLALKKNATILKFEERLDNGSYDGYLMATWLYTSPNGVRKTDTEGTNPEGKTLTKSDGTAETTANIAIKCETTGKEKVEENKT